MAWVGPVFVVVAFIVPSGRLYQGKGEDESRNKQIRRNSR